MFKPRRAAGTCHERMPRRRQIYDRPEIGQHIAMLIHEENNQAIGIRRPVQLQMKFVNGG